MFDTYLYVLDQNCNVVASNDDGGVGTSSALVFAAATDGVYTVVATAFYSTPADQYGAFRLRISQGDAGGECLATSGVIGIGEDTAITLSGSDPADGPRGSGYAYEDFGLYLQAGEAFTVQFASDDFEPWIGVMDPSCALLSQDDGVSYTENARLTFTAPAAGNYTLVLGTDEQGGSGSGRAQVAMGRLGNHCFSNQAHATLPREYLDKELTAFDPTEGGPLGSGHAWDDYEFVGGPGAGLSVHAVSLDADLFLAAYDESCQPLLSTDGDATDFSGEVGISVTPADWAQVLTVAVSAATPGELGRTLISAANLTDWNQCGSDNRGLMIDELVHGQIDAGDGGSGPLGGQRWDDFELVLEAGDDIDLVVDALDFNPALAILDDACTLVASNRDGATNDGALLQWTAPADGVYTVVVEAEDAAATGEYFLQYSEDAFEGCDTWSDADVIGPGLSDFDGTLTAGDESGHRSTFGTHYHDDIDLFLYAGQQVQIDLGGSLDNYLYLLDDQCTQVASDDDSGPSLDSRIVYTAPNTGVYTVIASTYNASATGPYLLSVEALNEF